MFLDLLRFTFVLPSQLMGFSIFLLNHGFARKKNAIYSKERHLKATFKGGRFLNVTVLQITNPIPAKENNNIERKCS